MFKDLFKEILSGYNFSDEEISKMAADVSAVFVLAVIGTAQEKLNDAEKAQIKSFWQNKEIDKIVVIVKGKYSEEEWKSLTSTTLQNVLDSWTESILNNSTSA